MHTAIRAAANSAVSVVRQALEADPDLGLRFNPGLGGLMRVSLRTPEEMAEQNTDGLSVFLYHIGVDDHSRNRPPQRPALDRERPRPLPLKLRILFTPVVFNLDPDTAPLIEQEIIGKVIQIWHSHPFIRGADLADELAGTGTELAMRIEPLDLESISRIWDALEQSFQLCVSYELSLVEITSAEADMPVAPVLSYAAPVGLIAPEAGS